MDFKEWTSKHRSVWIFSLVLSGIFLGFLEPLLLGSNNIFRQGFSFEILYAFVFVTTELTCGGDDGN